MKQKINYYYSQASVDCIDDCNLHNYNDLNNLIEEVQERMGRTVDSYNERELKENTKKYEVFYANICKGLDLNEKSEFDSEEVMAQVILDLKVLEKIKELKKAWDLDYYMEYYINEEFEELDYIFELINDIYGASGSPIISNDWNETVDCFSVETLEHFGNVVELINDIVYSIEDEYYKNCVEYKRAYIEEMCKKAGLYDKEVLNIRDEIIAALQIEKSIRVEEGAKKNTLNVFLNKEQYFPFVITLEKEKYKVQTLKDKLIVDYYKIIDVE